MEEIFKFKIKKNLDKKGAILLAAIIILTSLMLLGLYFLSFTISETKISKAEQSASQAYYVAEAGINEVIWKLKNDHTTADGDNAFADDFIDPIKNPSGGPYWSDSFTHSFGGATYIVSIQNYDRGAGDIISTSRIPIGNGKYAQRIVKVAVFKAFASPVANRAMFTGGASGNIRVSSSNIIINNGNLFSGNTFNISSSAITLNDDSNTAELEGQLLSHGNLIQSSTTINSTATCASNICTSSCANYAPNSCPPDSGNLPMVDFDSSAQNSFKSRAQAAQNLNQCSILCNGNPCSTKCVLTSNEFSNLFSGVNNVVINSKITFVTGNINVSSKNLTVNGILISANDINISSSTLTINRPGAQDPSGLMAEKGIELNSSTINITGVIYSSDEMEMSSTSGTVTGAILARKVDYSSLPSLTINLDDDVILYGLGYMIDEQAINPVYSPVITVDHWEESY